MMNFKNKLGFTLFEVLLALAVVGLTIMPVFNLQSIFVSAVDKAGRTIEASLEAKQFLMRSLFDLDDVSKEQETSLFTTHYEKVKIATISVLQNIDHLMKTYVTISWPSVRGMQEKQLVCFWQETEKSVHNE